MEKSRLYKIVNEDIAYDRVIKALVLIAATVAFVAVLGAFA